MSERDALVAELRRQIADLTRHNQQLREAIDALLQPARSEVLPQTVGRLYTSAKNRVSERLLD